MVLNNEFEAEFKLVCDLRKEKKKVINGREIPDLSASELEDVVELDSRVNRLESYMLSLMIGVDCDAGHVFIPNRIIKNILRKSDSNSLCLMVENEAVDEDIDKVILLVDSELKNGDREFKAVEYVRVEHNAREV